MFGLSTLNFEKLVIWDFIQTYLEAIQEHLSSFVFPLFLEHLEINESFSNSIVKRTWLRDGHFVSDKHARISPEQRVINQPFGTQHSCGERGKSQNNGLVTGALFRGTQRQFSENICSEDDLRSTIFGAFVVKYLGRLPLLGFSKWCNCPFFKDFCPKKVT